MTSEGSNLYFLVEPQDAKSTVKCLGLTFESAEARRAYLSQLLADKLKDTAFRRIEVVAGKIPEEVLQQDAKLLMWYDQAMTRAGANS